MHMQMQWPLFPDLPPAESPPRRPRCAARGANEPPAPSLWAQLALRLVSWTPRSQYTRLDDLIRDSSPRRPACFDTHAQWVGWLLSAHHAGKHVLRRVDVGKSAGRRRTWWEVRPVGQQEHCADCTVLRRAQMREAGRCFPVRPQARVVVVAGER